MQLQLNPEMYFLKYKQMYIFYSNPTALVQINDTLNTYWIQLQYLKLTIFDERRTMFCCSCM